jgi:hypothetical protein
MRMHRGDGYPSDAESGVGLDLEQGLQRVALGTGKAGVDLSIDMTFRLQQGGRNGLLAFLKGL